MRLGFSLIPEKAITMVNHAKFHAAHYCFKNRANTFLFSFAVLLFGFEYA